MYIITCCFYYVISCLIVLATSSIPTRLGHVTNASKFIAAQRQPFHVCPEEGPELKRIGILSSIALC